MKQYKKGQEGVPWLAVTIIITIVIIIIGILMIKSQGGILSNLFGKMP